LRDALLPEQEVHDGRIRVTSQLEHGQRS